jgi:hypothetical protein
VAPATAILDYDIPQWAHDGSPRDPKPYRLPQPRQFVFGLSAAAEENLRRALSVHSMTINGLTKAITRIRATWQVRQCQVPTDAVRNAESPNASVRTWIPATSDTSSS